MESWMPLLTGLLSGLVTLAVCLINNSATRKSAEAKQDEIRKSADAKQNETINMITYKIDELTKHVEKHNQVIDRVYALEEKAAVCEERMKVANNRIADLEHITNHNQ